MFVPRDRGRGPARVAAGAPGFHGTRGDVLVPLSCRRWRPGRQVTAGRAVSRCQQVVNVFAQGQVVPIRRKRRRAWPGRRAGRWHGRKRVACRLTRARTFAIFTGVLSSRAAGVGGRWSPTPRAPTAAGDGTGAARPPTGSPPEHDRERQSDQHPRAFPPTGRRAGRQYVPQRPGTFPSDPVRPVRFVHRRNRTAPAYPISLFPSATTDSRRCHPARTNRRKGAWFSAMDAT
ncbi:hypothetical protein SAMN02787118_13651 [Streptomyces mirabilis]|uniref:Uncharacterized protein n=1 Tax=Streptomyces mirabilis TaxID=68239 RepID=A0A1I2WC37_9ACTN|nr:hypothetical protein SAMN02787118_13651 [Streptomyces mirabilis]